MSIEEVIRAWKDPEYRQSLSDEDVARLPAHPSGLVELPDELLALASGAGGPGPLWIATGPMDPQWSAECLCPTDDCNQTVFPMQCTFGCG